MSVILISTIHMVFGDLHDEKFDKGMSYYKMFMQILRDINLCPD